MNRCMYMFDYHNKDFYGIVLSPMETTIYEIDDIDHMIDIMEMGYMEHIDDVEGLEIMLRKEGIIDKSHYIVLKGAL